jgi:hypothetical protein
MSDYDPYNPHHVLEAEVLKARATNAQGPNGNAHQAKDSDPELRAEADAERQRYGESKPKPNGHDTAATGVSLEDFYAYMPMHNYIYAPTMAAWPGSSVNSRIPPVKLTDESGEPVLNEGGKPIILIASAWLDRFKPVEQMTWMPGLSTTIRNRLILEGGWIDRSGVTCLNLYRPPTVTTGSATEAAKWVGHVRYVYPTDANHILDWLAHRVQRPQDKINHALVLGGAQGIGKDSLLAACRT